MGLKYENNERGKFIKSDKLTNVKEENAKVRLSFVFETKPGEGLRMPPEIIEHGIHKIMDDILGPMMVGMFGFDGSVQIGMESVPAGEKYVPEWVKKEQAAEAEAIHAEAEAILRGGEGSADGASKS